MIFKAEDLPPIHFSNGSRRRVIKACSEFDETLPDDDAMTIAYAQHEASRPPLFTIPLADDEIHRPLCAQRNGFSLHANLDVHKKDRKKLERLLRYGLRPPFAQKRLSLLAVATHWPS